MLLFSFIPIPFIVLVLTLRAGNGISAVPATNPFFKFDFLHPPQTTVFKLDEDEYRSIFDFLRRKIERKNYGQIGDDSFGIGPFPGNAEKEQNREQRHAIFGNEPKHLPILEATYFLTGRRPIVSKRFNRIGGNIMMGKKK